MTKLNEWKIGYLLLPLSLMMAVLAHAQTFTTLFSFSGEDGLDPMAALTQATDGNLYGTTYLGGEWGNGSVFKFSSVHGLVTLYSFCQQPSCVDGIGPLASVILSTDGYLYGTTNVGGAYDHGTVFNITKSGTLTTLHSFNITDGESPQASLIQAIGGDFYGTTILGGSYLQRCSQGSGCGTVFRITREGTLTTLNSFNQADGGEPEGSLIQATDGNFYGTTTQGGLSSNCGDWGCGTVFRMTRQGKVTRVYSFCSQSGCPDGSLPVAGLVQGTDGSLYGTTVQGGADLVDCEGGCGTVFKITPDGRFATVHNFTLTDGAYPDAGLIQATDGNLYGTAGMGGDLSCHASNDFPGCGTLFQLTPGGILTTLHNFELTEGAYPVADLLQATDGNFYGVTIQGGVNCQPYGCGAIFRLASGLGPFVTFVSAAGRVGQTGPILGQGFTGTTSVMLNGVPADFTVVSDTYIKATVPQGASTGYVTVTTPSGTLTSNKPFYVIP